MIHILEMFRVI